jgi:hypothetical protein
MGTWEIAHPERLDVDGEVRRLDVQLVHGRLNVVGTAGPARIEVTAIGERSDSGTLTVQHKDMPKSKWPWWWWLMHRKFRVDVSIAVPHAAPATLNLVHGSIVASALRGGGKFDAVTGRITLLGLDGAIRAKVISGPIEALSLGGQVELETVSGEITVAESTAHRIRARTISGALTCDLDNPPEDSEIKLETTSGEITARVREDSDLRVLLHAVSGRVTCAFDELPQHSAKSVEGRLGAGTGSLYANAVSGNIALLRRPVTDDHPVTDDEDDR